MKHSQLQSLIANLWLIGSFLVDDIFGTLCMILLAMLWIIASIFSSKSEMRLIALESDLNWRLLEAKYKTRRRK